MQILLVVAMTVLASTSLTTGRVYSLPLPGGGPAETDCHAEFATTLMRLNYPPLDPQSPEPRLEVRCFDGEAGCDLDGRVDGVCTFDVDVCLRNADPNLSSCTPQDIRSASAFDVSAGVALSDLEAALAALLPARQTSCTEGQTVSVSTSDSVVKISLRIEATTTDDITDTDEVTLACVPHGWPSHGFNYGNHRSNPMHGTIDVDNAGALGVKWRFDIADFEQGRAGYSVTSTPVVGFGKVFITSWNGKIYALDQNTGELVWNYEAETLFLGLEGSPTLTADGRIVITADKAVECLDASDGRRLWRTVLSDAPESEMWGAATVANGRVFVGIASAADAPCASEGQLAALDLDTGELLWRYITTPEMICQSDTGVECANDGDCPRGGPCIIGRGAGITARPATSPDGETVFANTVGCFTNPSIGDSDSILAFDAVSGALRCKNRLREPEQFGFCADRHTVECRGDDDCATGTCSPKGLFHDFGFLNGPLYIGVGETGIGRPLIVSGSKDGSLYALDPDTGDRVWTNEVVPVPVSPGIASWGLFNGAITYSAGHIYAGLHDVAPSVNPDHLQSFNIGDGTTAWSQPFFRTWGDSSIANGVLLISDCGNNSTCNPECNTRECDPGAYYVVDGSDGRIIKRIGTIAPVAGGAAFVDGVAYASYGVASREGGVLAYAIACPGDCNLDDRTDISELTRGVGESLGSSNTAECGIFDRNGDRRISIDELVLAVRAALEGCPTAP